jgi:hypothetical protein
VADRSRTRDPAGQVAYGRAGPGRPRVAAQTAEVSATVSAADAAALDEAAARRGKRRPDMVREAIACFLRHHHAPP